MKLRVGMKRGVEYDWDSGELLVVDENSVQLAKVTTAGNLLLKGALGIGNSAAATTPGSVTRKVEVFDSSGSSLGFAALYDAIT